MPTRSLKRLASLPMLLAIACASQAVRETRLPSVAARHTSNQAAALAAPAPLAAPTDDAAHKFDPPAELRLPAGLLAGERVPLLFVLHGFGVPSGLLIAKAGLDHIADQKKFAYLAPEGARDRLGRPYWNAGKSCCDLDHRQVDDVTRLRQLLDDNLSNVAIDPTRVFLIGYSNGGFMAQRLAYDVRDRIAGVVSVAGAAPAADVPCAQNSPLAFLEIHGDADPIVHYAGGTVFDRADVSAHTSAPETANYWAQHLSCTGGLHDVQTLDLEPYVPAEETSGQRYDGCRGAVELWTVKGGGHYVALQPPALEAIWSFVLSHPKAG